MIDPPTVRTEWDNAAVVASRLSKRHQGKRGCWHQDATDAEPGNGAESESLFWAQWVERGQGTTKYGYMDRQLVVDGLLDKKTEEIFDVLMIADTMVM